MDAARRQLLENYFFEDIPLPANMTTEDKQYILLLSRKWDRTLLNLYGKIAQKDSSHGETEQSLDKAR